MNSIKKITIKNDTHYFFIDTINKNHNPNQIKIDEKSYKDIIYYVGYVTPNRVKPLCFIINKKMESLKQLMKNNEKLWDKTTDLIR